MKLRKAILIVLIIDILACCWIILPSGGHPDGLTSMFQMLLVTAAVFIAAVILAFKQKKKLAICMFANIILAPLAIYWAMHFSFRAQEYAEYGAISQYVCYDVKDVKLRQKNIFHNYQLELQSRNHTCELCTFDQRYPFGGFSASTGASHGVYSQKPDGSYIILIEQDTLILRNDTLYGLSSLGGVCIEKVR